MPLQISIRRIRRPTCITVKAHNIPGARAVPLRHQVLIQAVAVVKVPITEAAAVGVAMTPRLLVGFERGLVDVALLAGVTNEAGDADARRGWSSVAGRQHTFYGEAEWPGFGARGWPPAWAKWRADDPAK